MREKKYLFRYLFAIATLPALLFGQTNTENFAQLEFNFNNPGARAAALGGAFISLADDATAAEANPAGLTALLKPEVSVELKSIQYTRNIFNFDANGTASDFKLIGRDFNDNVVSPAFASAVYPINNFTISAFRHELVNFKSEYQTRGALVPGFTDGSFYFAVDNKTDIKVVNWGVAGGYRLSERLSVGAAVGVSQLDMNSVIARFDGNATIANGSRIDDADQDIFINVGLLFKPNDKLSIGGTFKRRPKFTIENSLVDFQIGGTAATDINFNVPSAFGLGMSYLATDVLTFSVDIVNVLYSELTKDFVITSVPGAFQPKDFEATNGTEIHFGGEYVGFLNNIGYVLRAGFFTEPSSSIEFVGDPNTGSFQVQFSRRLWQTLFTEGDSDTHITLGLGLLLNEHFQLDIAGDFAEGSDELIGSLVFRL